MEVNKSTEFLQELKYFRWILYHHRDSNVAINCARETTIISEKEFDENEEIIGGIVRYHCDHGNEQPISEELVIANYDVERVIKCWIYD